MKKLLILSLAIILAISCTKERDCSPYPFDTTYKVYYWSMRIDVLEFTTAINSEYIYLVMLVNPDDGFKHAAYLVTNEPQTVGASRVGTTKNEVLYMKKN